MSIEIQVKKSARRRRSIQLRAVAKGVVELRVPMRYTVDMLAELLSSHVKFLAKAHSVSHSIVPGIISNNAPVFFFGEEYRVRLINDRTIGTKATVNTDEKLIIIHSKREKIQRASFYNSVAHFLLVYLESRVGIIAAQMGGLQYKRVRTKLVRSLWGSCSHSGNLTFNKRLVHYPGNVIDYVIVHELAHLVYRDHSAKFWNLVEKYYAEFRDHRHTLKQNRFG